LVNTLQGRDTRKLSEPVQLCAPSMSIIVFAASDANSGSSM
jgi:hypothetical protein